MTIITQGLQGLESSKVIIDEATDIPDSVIDSLVPSNVFEPQTFEEALFIAFGQVSVCWSELPKGVFDSSKVLEIGKKLMEWHEKEKQEAYNAGEEISL